MGSMNISIKQEAYDFLKARKSEDKSFSDVILSFKKKKSIMDFWGCLKDKKDWAEVEKNTKEFRKSFLNRDIY